MKDPKIELFADGADLASILKMYQNPLICSFTTYPTLMRKVGVTDYETFAKTSSAPFRIVRFRLKYLPMSPMRWRGRLRESRSGAITFIPRFLSPVHAANVHGILIRRLARQGVRGLRLIIATNHLLHKLALVGKDLDGNSLDTKKIFHRDATQAGSFGLRTPVRFSSDEDL